MGIHELLIEILERYPLEYKKNNKTSSAYYKDLKVRIEQAFEPLLEEFGLRINALGGMGVMRKSPYISFLAEGHQTCRGFYPGFQSDIEQQCLFLSFDDADDNPPPKELTQKFASKARELLAHFELQTKDGYPRKVYAKDELAEERIIEDLRAVFEIYQLCLDEFDEEIQEYLQNGKSKSSSSKGEIIWAIQAGSGGQFWEEWQQYGCISIGWSKLGNLSHLTSVEEFQSALIETYPTEINQNAPHMTYINDANTLNYFINQIQTGDLVAAIKGRHTILGIGQITGEYEYTQSSTLSDPNHTQIRKVKWLATSSFQTEVGSGLPLKTLTPLYPNYKNYQRVMEQFNENSGHSFTPAQMIALIDQFWEWYAHDSHKGEEIIEEYQNFSQEYFASLTDDELVETMCRFAREGGRIQSGGERTTGIFRKSIESQIKQFRQQILETFSEDFELEKWWNEMKAFKGFGKGIKSIFLHRVFPERFTIFNNKSQQAYQALKLLPSKKPHGAFEYGLLNEAAKKLISYRPDILNFYRADAMTHFMLGTEEGQKAFSKIQSMASHAIAQTGVEPANYWWLNANPNIWDFNSLALGAREFYTSNNEQGNKRQVYAAFQEVKAGDIILGYVTSPQRKIVAICKVTQGLHQTDEGEAIEFEKIEQLNNPIDFQALQTVPELQQCRPIINNQGSLFPIRSEEYDVVRAIIDETNPPVSDSERVEPEYSLEQCAEETGFALEALQRWTRAIERKKQAIFYGPPGTGKTFIAEQLARHIIGGGDGFSELVQFHPAYAYEDFMQGIRPQSRPDGGLDYSVVDGCFLEFCKKARSRNGSCVLIIDEINRANLARVFGELMYLLEYREKEAALASGERFSIPGNVRIIGTMNTADRSIALVDYALRRRFAFLALHPDYDVLRHYHARHETGCHVDELIPILKRLNHQIGDRHYEVGISFFLRQKLEEELEDIWQMEIEPYLEEFFFDQAAVVEEFRWEQIAPKVLS